MKFAYLLILIYLFNTYLFADDCLNQTFPELRLLCLKENKLLQAEHIKILWSDDLENININTTDTAGNTALHITSLVGDIEKSKALLAQQADPNLQNSQGNTPLHYAALQNHLQIVELLVNHNAQIDIQNNLLKTAADLTADSTIQQFLRLSYTIEQVEQAEHGKPHYQFFIYLLLSILALAIAGFIIFLNKRKNIHPSN